MQQHEANREQRRQKRAATHDAYRVATNQWRMVARRVLEWIGTSNTRLVFRYEYQTCLVLGPATFVCPRRSESGRYCHVSVPSARILVEPVKML